jgi:hypothetical protein
MGATLNGGGRCERTRREAVDCLDLRAADTVLEVGCHNPVVTALIAERIWPGGRIVCVAESDALARVRDTTEGYEKVTLVEGPVETAELPHGLDAALFSHADELLRSERAVAKVVHHLHLGARIAAFGASCLPIRGSDPPWGILERYLPHLTVRRRALTGAYVACGTLERAPAAAVTK